MRWSRIIEWGTPRNIGSRIRCALLDGDGRQCLGEATKLETIHGNPEYDDGWYAVPFCDRHVDEDARKYDYRHSPTFPSY